MKSLINKLGALNETTLAEFNVNVIMDLFPEDNTKKIFAQIDAILSDAEIEKAVDKHCELNTKCQHPFLKLTEEKAKTANQKTLKSAFDSYAER